MPQWEEFQTALTNVTLALRYDERGRIVPKLPPPISAELIADATTWMRDWLNHGMKGPKPGGLLQSAAFALAYAATVCAANAAATREPPLSGDTPDGDWLEILIFKMWPIHNHEIWNTQWELAYRERAPSS
jgi:hypothetical protein